MFYFIFISSYLTGKKNQVQHLQVPFSSSCCLDLDSIFIILLINSSIAKLRLSAPDIKNAFCTKGTTSTRASTRPLMGALTQVPPKTLLASGES